MASESDAPVDLYVAAYSDPDAAQADWDDIKQLVKDKVIIVNGLLLVSRDESGKIDVKDDAHVVGAGAVVGAAGGLLVGLIFPPALLASGGRGRRHRRRHRRASLPRRQEGDQGRGRR